MKPLLLFLALFAFGYLRADDSGFPSGGGSSGGQPLDAELTALAGTTSAANKVPYYTGSGTASTADLTALARTFLAYTTTAQQRAGMGLVIGTDVLAANALQAPGPIGSVTPNTGAFTTVTSPQVILAAGVYWSCGTGTPEGVVSASVGSLFSRLDGSTGTTLYYKASGTGNTGWVAIAGGGGGTWGSITGTLSSQTDLASALAGKQPLHANLTALAALTSVAELGKEGVHGTDIASASTINLETATGAWVDVTGTTGITAITLNEGHFRWVRFTGSLTLTHSSSLVLLNSGNNVITASGNWSLFAGGSGGVVREVTYSNIDGSPRAVGALYGTDGYRLHVGYKGVLTGTPYPLTTTPLTNTPTTPVNGNPVADVIGGTTSPSAPAIAAGTYEIRASIQIDYAGATITNQTMGVQLWKTNGSQSAQSNAQTIILPQASTQTFTAGTYMLEPQEITLAAGDTITLRANLSTAPGAGAVNAAANGTWVTLRRLNQ